MIHTFAEGVLKPGFAIEVSVGVPGVQTVNHPQRQSQDLREGSRGEGQNLIWEQRNEKANLYIYNLTKK